jgi:hypothetical protein
MSGEMYILSLAINGYYLILLSSYQWFYNLVMIKSWKTTTGETRENISSSDSNSLPIIGSTW